jgi:hypothetical protein
MARIHLFEFEDFHWFPKSLRGFMVDYLEFMGKMSAQAYTPFSERLAGALRKTGDNALLDLCSGSSGPLPSMLLQMDAKGVRVNAKLTDLYPNLSAFERVRDESGGRVDFVSQSVDATNVPADMKGFRTICNGFHHLPTHLARKTLEDAVRSKKGIALVEVVSRTPLAIFSIFVGTLISFFITPAIRPFRWTRLFWTYIIPVLPLLIFWDGLISCLRVYSPKELEELVQALPSYHWEIGRLPMKGAPGKVTYLIGTPV